MAGLEPEETRCKSLEYEFNSVRRLGADPASRGRTKTHCRWRGRSPPCKSSLLPFVEMLTFPFSASCTSVPLAYTLSVAEGAMIVVDEGTKKQRARGQQNRR